MAGPQPKPGRARRNVPVKEQNKIVLPAEGPDGPIPVRTMHTIECDACAATWAEWWGSPMATQWLSTDAIALERLLSLHHRLMHDTDDAAAPTGSTISEMRMLESHMGLTPKGRRELNWVIADLAVQPTPDTTATQAATTPKNLSHDPDDDPRRGLRAI